MFTVIRREDDDAAAAVLSLCISVKGEGKLYAYIRIYSLYLRLGVLVVNWFSLQAGNI